MRTSWTPEIQRRAADLSAQGLSAADIAVKLGVSKDACASAMSRYGLFARPRAVRREREREMVA